MSSWMKCFQCDGLGGMEHPGPRHIPSWFLCMGLYYIMDKFYSTPVQDVDPSKTKIRDVIATMTWEMSVAT